MRYRPKGSTAFFGAVFITDFLYTMRRPLPNGQGDFFIYFLFFLHYTTKYPSWQVYNHI